MAEDLTVTERYKGRRLSTTQAERQYLVREIADDATAYQKVADFAPESIGSFVNRTIELEELEDKLWLGTVTWSTFDGQFPQAAKVRFSSKGGTQHLTQSIETVGRYMCRQTDITKGNPVPDFKGAIGVNADRIEGVDVPVPSLHFTISFTVENFAMTTGYQRTLVELVGATNSDGFMFFEPGEVTYLGAEWSNDDPLRYTVDLEFSASPNRLDLSVGDAKNIEKKGSDYLWVLYDESTDDAAKRIVQTPIAAYVERVARQEAFYQFNIPWS